MGLVILLLTVAVLALAERLWTYRQRWRWRELSLEARLREQATQAQVFERTLARLKADYQTGRLTLNDDYRSLFERLVSEVGAPADA